MFDNEDLGIKYFSLDDYINKIKISDKVKDHLDYTVECFFEYLEKILKYDVKYINRYWIYLLYNELKSNQAIEDYNPHNIDKIPDRLLSDNLVMSNKKIHELHDIIMQGTNKDGFEYRKTPVKISSIKPNGDETVFYYGVNHEDVDKFMADFIKAYNHIGYNFLKEYINIYKNTNSQKERDEVLLKSAFLKSALLHLLFIRIHPYRDGNGRTARVLQNLEFIGYLSKINGVNLKLSPINLSRSIHKNKITYVNILDNLSFNNIDDDNELINKWFDFMLNMADEQIYMSSNQADRIDDRFLKELDEAVAEIGTTDPRDNGVEQLKRRYK